MVRVGRSRTGLGLFATQEIKKGTRIIEYRGRMLDCKIPAHDDIENKYLFEINGRWTIDGSRRSNIARYANHSCRPNCESDVHQKKRQVFVQAIKTIQPGDEITYDYGSDYWKSYIKPIGCKCDKCEAKRKVEAAEARSAKKKAKARAEKRLQKKALNGHAGSAKATDTKATTTKAGKKKAGKKASKAGSKKVTARPRKSK
jgi:SET domain-containing protein